MDFTGKMKSIEINLVIDRRNKTYSNEMATYYWNLHGYIWKIQDGGQLNFKNFSMVADHFPVFARNCNNYIGHILHTCKEKDLMKWFLYTYLEQVTKTEPFPSFVKVLMMKFFKPKALKVLLVSSPSHVSPNHWWKIRLNHIETISPLKQPSSPCRFLPQMWGKIRSRYSKRTAFWNLKISRDQSIGKQKWHLASALPWKNAQWICI